MPVMRAVIQDGYGAPERVLRGVSGQAEVTCS
jgi:hypothetical protein